MPNFSFVRFQDHVSETMSSNPSTYRRPIGLAAIAVPSLFILSDPGRRRSAKFWFTSVPAFVHYKSVQCWYQSSFVRYLDDTRAVFHAKLASRHVGEDDTAAASSRGGHSTSPSSSSSSAFGVNANGEDPPHLLSRLESFKLKFFEIILGSGAFTELSLEQRKDQTFQQLHEFYSPKVRHLCHELRGMYLKNAQFMSLREDLVPAEYLGWCRKLQHMAPAPITAEQARSIIFAEVGENVFEEIDFENPVGSAAIGVVFRGTVRASRVRNREINLDPVHRAVRKKAEGGHSGASEDPLLPVAIKVQLPGTEAQFRADLKTMRVFCSFAYPSFIPGMDELERQFLSEFDYQREAVNGKLVQAASTKSIFHRKVKVPAVYDELCTKHVLVTELLHGTPLSRGLEETMTKIAAGRGVHVETVEEEFLERKRGKKYVSLERAKWEHGVAKRLYGLDFNPAEYVELLIHWWFEVLMLQGVCTTDCHPGNFMIMEDPTNKSSAGGGWWRWLLSPFSSQKSPRIADQEIDNVTDHPRGTMSPITLTSSIGRSLPNNALGAIDFGQMKRVPLPKRISLAKLVLALHEGRDVDAAQIAKEELDATSRYGRVEIVVRILRMWMSQDDPLLTTGELNLDELVHWFQKEDPDAIIDDDIVCVNRAAFMLRSLCLELGIRVEMLEIWAVYARELLRREGVVGTV